MGAHCSLESPYPRVRDAPSLRALIAALLIAVLALGAFAPPATADPSYERPLCPTSDGLRSEQRFDAARLVGRSMPAARKLANRHGCSVRVVKRNGEWLAVTEDFSPSRINVAVREGTVVRIVSIG